MSSDAVRVGQRWAGITGNVMEVLAVEDERAKLDYVRAPEGDDWWETFEDITSCFTLALDA